jgi:hypothetical protein
MSIATRICKLEECLDGNDPPPRSHLGCAIFAHAVSSSVSSKMLSSWRRPAGWCAGPMHPLEPVRSMVYFLPVIEEVLELRVNPDYFQYLRHKLQRIAAKA